MKTQELNSSNDSENLPVGAILQKKKVFEKAGLVVVWEDLEAILGTNLEIFQQMFKDLEYKQFCKIISHLENGWVVTVDLNSIQEVEWYSFPTLIRRFEVVSLEDMKDELELEFKAQSFDQMDVYVDVE